MKIPKIKNPLNFIDSIVVILGIIFIFIGIFLIYPPAAWIVLGVIMSFPGIPKRKAVK